MDFRRELEPLIQGEIYNDDDTLDRFSRDASIFQVRPQIVVAPQNSEDIKKLVLFASSREGISLTVRSGGTDMSGGPLGNSVVLDMARHADQKVEVQGMRAIVKPGVFYRDFERETLKHQLLLPSYPASREICTVGGMVANNSGGEKSLLYGQTIKYVEALKMVLADGNEYSLGPMSDEDAQSKRREDSFEGKIYDRVMSLIERNADLIAASRRRVSKNSAGYQLWDIYDGKIWNLAKLFVGAQGTLGINTEITFRLIKPYRHSRLLVIFLKDINELPDMVKRVLLYKPESFESFEDKTLKLALRFLPEFVSLLGAKNIFSLGLQFLPEFWMTVSGGIPKLILLAEFTGDVDGDVERRVMSARNDLRAFNVKTRIVSTEKEAKKYWTIRRESFNLLRRHIRGMRTVPFIDDVIIPPERLPEFLPRLEQILAPYKLIYSIFGHVGDGNLHVIPLMKEHDPEIGKVVSEIAGKVYDLVLSYGGSITAEHNDGLIRGAFLPEMYGAEIYKIFEEIKRIFDPKNVFNPGKKIGVNWQEILKLIH